jgi:hypothetical protein
MTKTTVHLLIVTGHTQANLIPVLQLKPDIIALAVSDAMRGKADDFSKLLKTVAGYTDETIIRYDHVAEVGLKTIEEKAMDIAIDLQERYPDCALTYHATGGTKLMTLGFLKCSGLTAIKFCTPIPNMIASKSCIPNSNLPWLLKACWTSTVIYSPQASNTGTAPIPPGGYRPGSAKP